MKPYGQLGLANLRTDPLLVAMHGLLELLYTLLLGLVESFLLYCHTKIDPPKISPLDQFC